MHMQCVPGSPLEGHGYKAKLVSHTDVWHLI